MTGGMKMSFYYIFKPPLLRHIHTVANRLLPILRLGTFTGQRSSAGVDKKPESNRLNGWLSKS
jgi:hypothetical protein